MAVQRLARWSLSITMLFAVVPAVAQTNSPTAGAGGGGKFRAACGEDLQRFCAGVQPGGGRLVQCLSSHTNELSAACGNVIAAAGRGGAKIRAACDQDLQRYCVGVQPGRGRLIQCLSSRTSELSTTCGNMIAAIRARKGTSNASAQSPATQPAAPATVGHSSVTIGTILRASCANPGPGECSEQKATAIGTNHANPGPEQKRRHRQSRPRRMLRTKSHRHRNQPLQYLTKPAKGQNTRPENFTDAARSWTRRS